MDRISFLL